jgi:hypothetical protein
MASPTPTPYLFTSLFTLKFTEMVKVAVGVDIFFDGIPGEPMKKFCQNFQKDHSVPTIVSYRRGGSFCIFVIKEENDRNDYLKRRQSIVGQKGKYLRGVTFYTVRARNTRRWRRTGI